MPRSRSGQQGVFFGQPIDWIAFPHPSGLSSWHKTEPGKTLLAQALATFAAHPSFLRTFGGELSKDV